MTDSMPLPGDDIRVDLVKPNKVQITITCKSSLESSILFQDIVDAAASGFVKLELGLKKFTKGNSG